MVKDGKADLFGLYVLNPDGNICFAVTVEIPCKVKRINARMWSVFLGKFLRVL